ncbi:MAG TPA: response regulator transcription factor [Chloroflexota bacterium]|nr:response regulator transcription factor [Chloroflexota bacterium]
MNRSRSIIIVAEDSREVVELRRAISADGHVVHIASNGSEVDRRITEDLPDLVVIGGHLGQDSEFEILAAIRRSSSVPIIVLLPDADESKTVDALDRGADDCVRIPWGERELRSRVRAVLRRAETPAPTPKTRILVDDYLAIDFDRHEVVAGGQRVPLRPTEYRLLYHLVNNAGRVLTHETLLAKVWGYEYRSEEHYVRLYVNYLRQKIEEDPRRPRYILNERGLGYRFVDLPVAQPQPVLARMT